MMTPYLRYRLQEIRERSQELQTHIQACGKIWSPLLNASLPMAVLRAVASQTQQATCGSMSDVRLLAEAGFQSFIITRPVVESQALNLLASMTAQHHFTVVVDHFRQAELLSHTLLSQGAAADVLLDVDLGRQTTGVRPGPDSVNLAAAAAQLPQVQLRGLFVNDRSTRATSELQPPQLSFADSLAVARHCQRMIQCSSIACDQIVTGFDFPGEAVKAAEVSVIPASPLRPWKSSTGSSTNSAVELVCRVLSRPSLEWCIVNAPARLASAWNSQTFTTPSGAGWLHSCDDVTTLLLSGESRDLRIGDEITISADAFAAEERHDLPFVTEA